MPAQLGIGQGGVVFDLANLGPRRKQIVEVGVPLCRVHAARAIAVHRRPCQHPLDAAPDPVRGFVLGRPDRLEHPKHHAGIDRAHRQPAEHRTGVAFQRRRPLLAVLGVSPTCLVALDVGGNRHVKGDRLGFGNRRRGPLGTPLCPGIDARVEHAAHFIGALPGLGGTHGMHRAQATLACFAADVPAVDPRLAPPASVFKYKLPPSARSPGVFAVATFRADSRLTCLPCATVLILPPDVP